TGFMGSGKTSAGRKVAGQLGLRFIDMDLAIEALERRTIPQIFEAEGEAYFRRLEKSVCRKLARQTGLVIATGGGTLVDPENLATMAATGLVICLTCAPDVLWQRLARSQDRPLLEAEDRRARLESLLAERQAAYARIEHQVDTTRQSLEETVAEIVGIWRLETGD
ncbi:MAG: shikimate kinase, partial [Anaerolineae bacterium]